MSGAAGGRTRTALVTGGTGGMGRVIGSKLADLDLAELDAIHRVNVRGTFVVNQHVNAVAPGPTATAAFLGSTPADEQQQLRWPAPTCLGAGFGLTAPSLNTLAAAFHPAAVDRSVLVLNALIGLDTALAPVFVAASPASGSGSACRCSPPACSRA